MAAHLGAAERLIAASIESANERHQFGVPIGSFQAVSHRLVEMTMRHDAARLQIYRAAAELGRTGRATLATAIAKLGGSEAIAAIALDAARVHGARGYATDDEVERVVRDALGSLVYAGTSDLQRNAIATLIGIATNPPRERSHR
jgi:L-prolyl-PCP dehydrogenase